MDINEINDHIDALSDVSNLRGTTMADVINGRTVTYDPRVDRYRINGTGGRWATRDATSARLLG